MASPENHHLRSSYAERVAATRLRASHSGVDHKTDAFRFDEEWLWESALRQTKSSGAYATLARVRRDENKNFAQVSAPRFTNFVCELGVALRFWLCATKVIKTTSTATSERAVIAKQTEND